MGIFGRRRRPRGQEPPRTGHALDDETLRQLALRTDLRAPRHWIHYLLCDDQDGAEQATTRITAAGWGLQRVDAAASSAGWIVIAEQHDVVLTAPLVIRTRAFFEDVAASVRGGDYDGWEASL